LYGIFTNEYYINQSDLNSFLDGRSLLSKEQYV
ncbi:hypothetical protein ACN38_g12314, partial [Penicillium nordicum]